MGLQNNFALERKLKMTELLFPDIFSRNFIGTDHLKSLTSRVNQMNSMFPPHNLEKTGDDSYVLTFALAGYSPEDISLSVHGDVLTVETVNSKSEEPEKTYLHRGISLRQFTRKLVLAQHVQISSADMRNGLLSIALERVVPESAKPKVIPIGYKPTIKAIESEPLKAVA
jgi:molecular chaperone IbpA